MSDIINKWISDRLGLILQDETTLEESTKCGRLVAEILNNYDIINDEQLKLIPNTDKLDISQTSYTHISEWLKRLSIKLSTQEIEEITNGKLSTIHALLYKLFLQLNNKSCLSYLANEAFNQKCRPDNTRFTVKPVKEANIDKVTRNNQQRRSHAQIIDNSFDILHWRQDRLEALINKCKAAREEYIGYVMRTRSRVFSSNVVLVTRPSTQDVPDEAQDRQSVASVNLDCKQLLDEKKRAKAMEVFVPDAQKARKIVDGFKRKQQKTAENNIMRSQLQNELLANFDRKIQSAESIETEQETYEKLLKQSVYEKQMITKVQDVKYQREVMLQDKQLINDAIAKENEKQFVESMLQKDKMLNEKEFQYYLEKERALQLHKTIYNERIRLRKERNEKLCSKIMEGIFSLAMKEAEHKETFDGEEPDERTRSQWYKHFLIDESLEDYVTPVEQIVTYQEDGSETDALIYKEIERQEKLDKYDFQCYQQFETPWSLITIDASENDREMMQCGMNVLGYIVFKLLEAKYPQHTFSDPIHFQDFTASVCVQGFIEPHIWLPTLQRLLEHKKIIVAEMQDGLHFCLDAYKRESVRDDEEDVVEGNEEGEKIAEKEFNKAKRDSTRLTRKSIRARTDSIAVEAAGVEEVETQKIDKKIQTPKLFPDEEPVLSKAAELGKIADEELSQGRALTDFLLIDMFKEYLKNNMNHMRGWVLVNYPDTLDQAALLEEALSGRHVPGILPQMKSCRSIIEIRDIDVEPEERSWDENEMYRKSQLVSNPECEKAQSYYETVLTAFIRVSQALNDTASNIASANLDTAEEESNNQHPEISDVTNQLDRFYSDQGRNYSLYYEVFDYVTIKHLARLILGDYNIPPKSSVELFGDSIKYINAENEDKSKTGDSTSPKASKRGERKEKPKEKILKPKEDVEEDIVSDKKRERRKTELSHKSIIVRVDKFTQIPEIEYEYVDTLDKPCSRPGSAGWHYVDLKIPIEVEILLANMWESLEQIYVDDFSQVLFMRRRLMNGLMPYVKVVKEYLDKALNRPDDMQLYLRQFQQIYNQFDDDIRCDDEFKAELHCRVHEMKEKLTDICDNKMSSSENERRNIIGKNWAPMQLTELFNCYVNGCQLEVDRFVDTINLIDDYYMSMINKLPNSEHVLSKEKFLKLEMDDASIIKATNDILIKAETATNLHSTFSQKVDDFHKRTTATVAKMYHVVLEKLEHTMDIYLPTNSAGSGGPKSKGSIKKDRRSDKDNNNKMEQSTKMLRTSSPPAATADSMDDEDALKRNYQRIFDEWQTVNNGEWIRLNVRLKLLHNDAVANLNEAMLVLTKCFHTAYDDIKGRYRSQIDGIGRACELLFSAIEEEMKIQEEMLFNKDGQFYVDPLVILFPDQDPAKPTIPTAAESHSDEKIDDYIFTIDQLTKLVSIFVSLAPSGVIATRSLTFLLQDMIVSEEMAMVPTMWTTLDVNQVEKLVWILYGSSEFMTWKDFIICNMQLPFPDENDILEMRKKFIELDPCFTEIISKENYQSTKLWFENDDVDKSTTSLKNLIFNMYGINDHQFNYTGFLSDYCKSNDNSLPEALAKALALAMGRKVCWDKEQGEKYVEETLEKRRKFDEEQRLLNEAETLKHVQEVQQILENEVLEKTTKTCTAGGKQPASSSVYEDDRESINNKCQIMTERKSLEQSTSVQMKCKFNKSNSATECSTISTTTTPATPAAASLRMRPSVRMRDDNRMGRPRKSTAISKGSTAFNIQTADISGEAGTAGGGGGGRLTRSTIGSKASRISRKSAKEFLAKLPQDIVDCAIEMAEQRAEEELANMELQSIKMDVNENPLEYFIHLNMVQEVLFSIIPENLKRTVIDAPDGSNMNGTNNKVIGFHDLVECYFNDLRRSDFNNEVLAHEMLNDPRFLALVAGTGKFTNRHPAKVVEEVIQEGK